MILERYHSEACKNVCGVGFYKCRKIKKHKRKILAAVENVDSLNGNGYSLRIVARTVQLMKLRGWVDSLMQMKNIQERVCRVDKRSQSLAFFRLW